MLDNINININPVDTFVVSMLPPEGENWGKGGNKLE
jgi:hypothetical protein